MFKSIIKITTDNCEKLEININKQLIITRDVNNDVHHMNPIYFSLNFLCHNSLKIKAVLIVKERLINAFTSSIFVLYIVLFKLNAERLLPINIAIAK